MLRKSCGAASSWSSWRQLAPTEIGLEACGASHHWARELRSLGHQVVLLPPQYVKPYVGARKNDKNDAEAICEAMSRPRVRERLVPVKSARAVGGTDADGRARAACSSGARS